MHRSETLWKEPEVLEWLQQTARTTAQTFTSSGTGSVTDPDIAFGAALWQKSPYPKNAVPEGILRHVLVADIQPLRLMLPQSVLNSQSFTYDPLPPGPGFDDRYFSAMYEGSGGRMSRTGGVDPSSRRRGGGRGVGDGQESADGLLQRLMQYIQSNGGAQGMDPDTEAAMIAQLEQFAAAAGHDGDGRGLPGDFPGLEGEESGSMDEEVDEDQEGSGPGTRRGQEAPSEGARGMMQFFRGLWGAQHGIGSGSRSDDHQDEGE